MKKNFQKRRLRTTNKIITPKSETTQFINYSYSLNILEVAFVGWRIYHYRDVPVDIWDEYKHVVESGGSSGTFVNTRIKPFYEFDEIE